GSGLFVLAGANGTVQTSPDGVNWTGTAQPYGFFSSISFGNDLFVAATGGDVVTSHDGVTWTNRVSITSGLITKIVYAGIFAAFASDGNVSTSSNGTEWINRGTAGLNLGSAANDTFFATDSTGSVFTSADALSWTRRGPGTGMDMSIVYGGGSYVGFTGTL